MRPLVIAVVLFWCSVASPSVSAQNSPSEKTSVQVTCAVQSAPARITVNWVPYTGATGYTVYRKLHSATSWGASVATTNGGTSSYVDNNVAANTLYEYRVVRASPDGTGYGYACSGIEIQPADYNGKVVLLVDGTIASAIATGLTQLQNDLKADGWVALRHDIASGTSVPSVRNLVVADYNADPTNVKAVYIIGHVPVPYSGNIAPDGHTDQHMGAWPCDAYYGEMNGSWTDNSVNNTSGWDANKNIPGDGKFDQNSPSNSVELQVGRVDLYDLPYFSQTYTQLMANYLARAHDFRTRTFVPQTRGIIWDHLQDITTPLAGAAWMGMPGMVGTANITEVDFNSATWLENLVDGQSYLWTYGSGGGLLGNDNGVLMFQTTDRIANTMDLPNISWGGVFNMMMGSYIGDWNNRNNVMRGLLCSGTALVSVYSGPPNWWFHPMGMGKTAGYCAQLTMNNSTLYLPQSGSDVNPAPRSALGLMGDPTLELFNVDMPSNLVITNVGGNASFSWNAALGAPSGYHIYRFNAAGVPVRVNTNLITGTTYASAQTFTVGDQYMVRAVKLENTASGSYYNMSLGAMATASNALVVVSPRAYLEGPYNTSTLLMNDALRTAGLVPLSEPYTGLGFAQAAGGGGETTTQAVLNVTGNNAIVDWVRVELRAAGSPGIVMTTRQALLQRDGAVVSTDGISAVQLAVAPGSYHVVLRHRNHLGVMSATALPLSNATTPVDFTSASTNVFGSGARKTVGTIQALFAGNVVPDNVLKYTGTGNDRDPILTEVGGSIPTNTVDGYYVGDTNLDGTVKYTGSGNDRDIILVNIGGTDPTATRPEQVP